MNDRRKISLDNIEQVRVILSFLLSLVPDEKIGQEMKSFLSSNISALLGEVPSKE
jgi:hypothetical protein